MRRNERRGAARARKPTQRPKFEKGAVGRAGRRCVPTRPLGERHRSKRRRTRPAPGRRPWSAPPSPAPATRMSSAAPCRLAFSGHSVSTLFPCYRACLGYRDRRRRRCNFDGREAVRSSRRAGPASESRVVGRVEGMSIEKRPVNMRERRGFLRSCLHRVRRRRCGARALRGDRTQFCDVFRLAWARPFHRQESTARSLSLAKVQITAATIDGTVLDLVVDFLHLRAGAR